MLSHLCGVSGNIWGGLFHKRLSFENLEWLKPVSVEIQAFLNDFRPSRIPAFDEEQDREVGIRAGIRGTALGSWW